MSAGLGEVLDTPLGKPGGVSFVSRGSGEHIEAGRERRADEDPEQRVHQDVLSISRSRFRMRHESTMLISYSIR